MKVQPGKPFPQDRRNRQVNTYTQSKITGAETPEQKPPREPVPQKANLTLTGRVLELSVDEYEC